MDEKLSTDYRPGMNKQTARRFGLCLAISLLLSALLVGFVASLALQNGTHAVYCPAASAVWIFPCLPTFSAIKLALLLTGMFALPILAFLSAFAARG